MTITPKIIEANIQAGNYKEAEAQVNEVLKEHPESARAHLLKAEILVKEGKTTESQKEYNQVIVLDKTGDTVDSPMYKALTQEYVTLNSHVPDSGMGWESILLILVMLLGTIGLGLFLWDKRVKSFHEEEEKKRRENEANRRQEAGSLWESTSSSQSLVGLKADKTLSQEKLSAETSTLSTYSRPRPEPYQPRRAPAYRAPYRSSPTPAAAAPVATPAAPTTVVVNNQDNSLLTTMLAVDMLSHNRSHETSRETVREVVREVEVPVTRSSSTPTKSSWDDNDSSDDSTSVSRSLSSSVSRSSSFDDDDRPSSSSFSRSSDSSSSWGSSSDSSSSWSSSSDSSSSSSSDSSGW